MTGGPEGDGRWQAPDDDAGSAEPMSMERAVVVAVGIAVMALFVLPLVMGIIFGVVLVLTTL